MEKIIVLDFGGQYNQLIARRVREAGVYAEVLPYTAAPERLTADGELKGVILTGGPDSVYAEGAKQLPAYLLELGVPILGICYGMQALAHHLGGVVAPAKAGEFGHTPIRYADHPLFSDMAGEPVWMNHVDAVQALPEGFSVIADTDLCPIAAMADDARRLYAVQFHPEVHHTPEGPQLFKNFVFHICGCEGGWAAENLADSLIAQIRAQAGDSKVISALSGGVDSSVASVLVHKAIGDRLQCIFVDHGMLRHNEAKEVLSFYRDELGMDVHFVDASERFLTKLKGVTDPEQKRKIIGTEFIRVFEEEAKKLGGADYLVQGTIYPDVIESGAGSAAVIKSHHNVGGLPKNVAFKGLIEPLRTLFKDEVRALGESIGIPHHLVWRQPFPGPGLAVRIIGEITPEKLEIVRHSDYIFRTEVAEAGLESAIWQYFTVYTGVRSVGVMGDDRTYDSVVALRAVTSTDAMTVEFSELPYGLLRKISSRIINEVPGCNRVVYDITSKPPGTIEWE